MKYMLKKINYLKNNFGDKLPKLPFRENSINLYDSLFNLIHYEYRQIFKSRTLYIKRKAFKWATIGI